MAAVGEADVQFGAIRCLVTGANGGLGFEACAQLVKLGVGTVVVGCRTQAKADKAVEQLAEQTGAPASSFDTSTAYRRAAVPSVWSFVLSHADVHLAI